MRRLPSFCFVWLVLAYAATGDALAFTYTDAFTGGIDPTYWKVTTIGPLYTVDDTHGDVRFSRPSGGPTHYQSVSIDFRGVIAGDFDASIEFHDAWIDRVNGAPGNQIQLNVVFGGQVFAVVRSDETFGADNHHVYISPPQSWRGLQANTATAGTLRITRVGTTVSGYFGATLIYSGSFNADPVTQLYASLQNNGTNDSTAVTFDNFNLTATVVTAAGAVPGLTEANRLGAPYPNPSAGPFAFDVRSPGLSDATIAVYDVRGALVDVIRRGPLEPGVHTIRWPRGGGLPSGVYFVTMVSSMGTETRRVSIVR